MTVSIKIIKRIWADSPNSSLLKMEEETHFLVIRNNPLLLRPETPRTSYFPKPPRNRVLPVWDHSQHLVALHHLPEISRLRWCKRLENLLITIAVSLKTDSIIWRYLTNNKECWTLRAPSSPIARSRKVIIIIMVKISTSRLCLTTGSRVN